MLGHRLVIVACFVAVLAVTAASASDLDAVVNAVATRLDQTQIKQGVFAGDWGGEWGYNGSVVAGLADAYERTGNETYKAAALLGGEFILNEARGELMGDEAYALVRLSEITSPPQSSRWRDAATAFLNEVAAEPNGVYDYTNYYLRIEPSTAVYYLSHFAVAARRANALGADCWREVVIRHLTRVSDPTATFPVMALGVATWALAETGELDDTLTGSYENIAYWKGVRLQDLPSLLLEHQVPATEPFAGSFYWRFDHTSAGWDGPASGWTEDAVYGVLGLVAAASLKDDAGQDMKDAIEAALGALLEGSTPDGIVYEHLSHAGKMYHVFGGALLQALHGTQAYLDAITEVPSPEVIVPAE